MLGERGTNITCLFDLREGLETLLTDDVVETLELEAFDSSEKDDDEDEEEEDEDEFDVDDEDEEFEFDIVLNSF